MVPQIFCFNAVLPRRNTVQSSIHKNDAKRDSLAQIPAILVCEKKSREFAKKIGMDADKVLRNIKEFAEFVEREWRDNRGVMFVKGEHQMFPISWQVIDCAVSLFKAVIYHLSRGFQVAVASFGKRRDMKMLDFPWLKEYLPA